MTLVTVCLPAYRSAAFIGHTLASLQAQSFRDFRVRIALEPIDPGATIEACRPFLADPRFELTMNPEQLGWDGNVRALLATVETPLFAVQPHDDVLHPDYLAALVSALQARPDASVAYCDAFLFGAQTGIRGSALPDAGRATRELAFFMAGAEGHPFRGVTRSTVLDRPFPSNQFQGFAVETEWALHLVQSGVALGIARPLYLKRALPSDSDSVTTDWRFRMEASRLQSALEHNRAQLLRTLDGTGDLAIPRSLVNLAAEGSMLRRWNALAGGRFGLGPVQLARAEAALAELAGSDLGAARTVAATIHLALSRHWQFLGDAEAGERAARAAVDSDTNHPEACLRLAQVLTTSGRLTEAVELIHRAARQVPLDVAVLLMADSAALTLARRYGAVVN